MYSLKSEVGLDDVIGQLALLRKSSKLDLVSGIQVWKVVEFRSVSQMGQSRFLKVSDE